MCAQKIYFLNIFAAYIHTAFCALSGGIRGLRQMVAGQLAARSTHHQITLLNRGNFNNINTFVWTASCPLQYWWRLVVIVASCLAASCLGPGIHSRGKVAPVYVGRSKRIWTKQNCIQSMEWMWTWMQRLNGCVGEKTIVWQTFRKSLIFLQKSRKSAFYKITYCNALLACAAICVNTRYTHAQCIRVE